MKQKKVYVKAMCEIVEVANESLLDALSGKGIYNGFDSTMGDQGANDVNNDQSSSDNDDAYDDDSGYNNFDD